MDDEGRVVSVFSKSASEAVGFAISEWKGEHRIDVRIYISSITDEGLVPTRKGISLELGQYSQLKDGVTRLGDVMSGDKLVARIKKTDRAEVRIGTNIYRGQALIYLRTFALLEAGASEWKPTPKGVSLRVHLYPKLLEGVEALGPVVDELQDN